MTTLPIPPFHVLAAAVDAWARGSHGYEAAAGLLIEHGPWLHRPDFVTACMGPCDPLADTDPLMWWVDWEAVAAYRGPASSSEHQIRRLAAELAGTDTATPLSDLIVGLDQANTALVLDAIAHTAGWHERHTTHTVTGWILRPDQAGR